MNSNQGTEDHPAAMPTSGSEPVHHARAYVDRIRTAVTDNVDVHAILEDPHKLTQQEIDDRVTYFAHLKTLGMELSHYQTTAQRSGSGLATCCYEIKPIADGRPMPAAYTQLSQIHPMKYQWERRIDDDAKYGATLTRNWVEAILIYLIRDDVQRLINHRASIPVTAVPLENAFPTDLPTGEPSIIRPLDRNAVWWIYGERLESAMYGAIDTEGSGRGGMPFSMISITTHHSDGRRTISSFLTDGPKSKMDDIKAILTTIKEHAAKDFVWLHFGGNEGDFLGTLDVQPIAEAYFYESRLSLRRALGLSRGEHLNQYLKNESVILFWSRWSDHHAERDYRAIMEASSLPPADNPGQVITFLTSNPLRRQAIRVCEADSLAILEVYAKVGPAHHRPQR